MLDDHQPGSSSDVPALDFIDIDSSGKLVDTSFFAVEK